MVSQFFLIYHIVLESGPKLPIETSNIALLTKKISTYSKNENYDSL